MWCGRLPNLEGSGATSTILAFVALTRRSSATMGLSATVASAYRINVELSENLLYVAVPAKTPRCGQSLALPTLHSERKEEAGNDAEGADPGRDEKAVREAGRCRLSMNEHAEDSKSFLRGYRRRIAQGGKASLQLVQQSSGREVSPSYGL